MSHRDFIDNRRTCRKCAILDAQMRHAVFDPVAGAVPKLVITHARDAERANRILEKAEKHCLISNSIKTETKLEPEVSFAGE